MVRERYQIDALPTSSTSATSSRTRNVVRLIEAFDILRKNGFEHLRLFVIGDQVSSTRACGGRAQPQLHKAREIFGFVPFETLQCSNTWRPFSFPSLLRRLGCRPRGDGCGTRSSRR